MWNRPINLKIQPCYLVSNPASNLWSLKLRRSDGSINMVIFRTPNWSDKTSWKMATDKALLFWVNFGWTMQNNMEHITLLLLVCSHGTNIVFLHFSEKVVVGELDLNFFWSLLFLTFKKIRGMIYAAAEHTQNDICIRNFCKYTFLDI